MSEYTKRGFETSIIPPDCLHEAIRVETRQIGYICGVAKLPNVSESDLDAYERAYDGEGSESDIIIARRLDEQKQAYNDSLPTITIYSLDLYNRDPLYVLESDIDEAKDWLDIIEQVNVKAEYLPERKMLKISSTMSGGYSWSDGSGYGSNAD